MLRYTDEAAKDRLWRMFGDDPEWQDVKIASETGGPLLALQQTIPLKNLIEFA